MASSFVEATREQLKLRMAFVGGSKCGKSVTSYRTAMALVQHYGGKVAVIDSENGSARKYIGCKFADDELPIKFSVKELKTYSPTEYTSSIDEAGKLGFKVIVIDSLSHAWMGKDGALETVDKVGGKNKFTDGWRAVTPMHNRMIDSILNSPAHILTTMRAKMEYVLEDDDKGKKVPKKLALAPIQRQGMEYEFDILADIDANHIMTVGNSRCPALDGVVIVKPGAGFVRTLIDWLDTGEAAAPEDVARLERVDEELLTKIHVAIQAKGWKPEVVRSALGKQYGVDRLAELTPKQAEEFYKTRLGGGGRSGPGSRASRPVEESSAQVSGNDSAEDVDMVEEGDGKDRAETNGVPPPGDMREQIADALAKPQPNAQSTDLTVPVTKAMISQVKRTIARFIKSGKGGTQEEANAKILRGIRRRNPKASCVEDLTWGQAQDLEASMLNVLDPIPAIEPEPEEEAATTENPQ